jgi:hypothetical protein
LISINEIEQDTGQAKAHWALRPAAIREARSKPLWDRAWADLDQCDRQNGALQFPLKAIGGVKAAATKQGGQPCSSRT